MSSINYSLSLSSNSFFDNKKKVVYKQAKRNWYIVINNETLSNPSDIIKSFSSLQNNWNSYGASKFGEKFLKSAYCFSKKLIFTKRIVPSPDGSIQFEYENEINHDYLEIDFYSNQKIEFLLEKNNETTEGCLKIKDIKLINSLILDTLYGR